MTSPTTGTTPPAVGLALSGGGFRAAAFGLGCMRALHDTGVLRHVCVVSGISGGSLLGALWAYGPRGFDEFDDSVVMLLRRGLQRDLAARVLNPSHLGAKALQSLSGSAQRGESTANRTQVLADLLADRAFGNRIMRDVTHPGVRVVLSATDLISAKAVRFGSQVSSCSGYCRIVEPVRVAEAVAASAAFPILLPALERTFTFERRGERRQRSLALTDGGVFDNLGLSVLEPGRNRAYTDHVYDCDYVIACDAGRRETGGSAGRWLPRRLRRSFDITYRKTQDGSRGRLHAAGRTGEIRGFVHTYLGMTDSRLPAPVAGLVPHERVNRYGTSFAAMRATDLEALVARGQQVTRLLLQHYCPSLLRE